MSDYQIDLYHAKKEVKENAKAAFLKTIETTNIMNMDDAVTEGIIDALLSAHPTLVQSFFRSLVSAAENVKNTHRFKDDQRSKATGELLELIANFDKPLPFI